MVHNKVIVEAGQKGCNHLLYSFSRSWCISCFPYPASQIFAELPLWSTLARVPSKEMLRWHLSVQILLAWKNFQLGSICEYKIWLQFLCYFAVSTQQISGGKSYFHLGHLDSDGSNSQWEPIFPPIISSSKVRVQYRGSKVLDNSIKIWLLVFFCFHTTVSSTDCDFFFILFGAISYLPQKTPM